MVKDWDIRQPRNFRKGARDRKSTASVKEPGIKTTWPTDNISLHQSTLITTYHWDLKKANDKLTALLLQVQPTVQRNVPTPFYFWSSKPAKFDQEQG